MGFNLAFKGLMNGNNMEAECRDKILTEKIHDVYHFVPYFQHDHTLLLSLIYQGSESYS